MKELCILPCDTADDDECYNYFIKSDDMTKTGCYFWQFRRHGLYKDFGDYYFGEAIRDVQLKIGDGKVLVKGREKANFLKEWFNVEELSEQLCSFKKSGGMVDKCCLVQHSKINCARRKCFLLRDAFNKSHKPV